MRCGRWWWPLRVASLRRRTLWPRTRGDKTKVSQMKRKAIKAGWISDAKLDGCLSEAKGQDFDHRF